MAEKTHPRFVPGRYSFKEHYKPGPIAGQGSYIDKLIAKIRSFHRPEEAIRSTGLIKDLKEDLIKQKFRIWYKTPSVIRMERELEAAKEAGDTSKIDSLGHAFDSATSEGRKKAAYNMKGLKPILEKFPQKPRFDLLILNEYPGGKEIFQNAEKDHLHYKLPLERIVELGDLQFLALGFFLSKNNPQEKPDLYASYGVNPALYIVTLPPLDPAVIDISTSGL
jgi:hypothetical protein